MNAQAGYSEDSSSSFAYVNYPLASETQPLQKPEVSANSQHKSATSPLRQRILDASEALRSIPRRKRKHRIREKKKAWEALQLEEATSKSRQRSRIAVSDPKTTIPVANHQLHGLEMTFSTGRSRSSKNAVDSMSFDSTSRNLDPFRVDDSIAKTRHAAGQHNDDTKNITSKPARNRQHQRSPSDAVDSEEADAWFNLRNQSAADENADDFDMPVAQSAWAEDTTFPYGEHEDWSLEESYKVHDGDAVGEAFVPTEAMNSEDEFPMDEGLLEEAAFQVECPDGHIQRCDNTNELPSETNHSIPQSSTSSEEFDCSSDFLANDFVPTKTTLADSSSSIDIGSANFAALGSTPLTPPPRSKESNTLVYATSSPPKESHTHIETRQPLSPDSPSAMTPVRADQGIRQGSPCSASSMVLSTPTRRNTLSTQLTVTTIAINQSEDLSMPQEPNSAATLRPDRELYSPLTPFVRSSFAKPLSKNSVLPSATPEIRMLTCFRTPAMLKALSSASSSTMRLFLEAYCLVNASTRQDCIQYFVFTDLFFPNTCPTLNGTYEGWQGSELWEHDTGVFLTDGIQSSPRICRAIVTSLQGNKGHKGMAAQGKGSIERGQSMDVQVLNIWEANWEDIRFARGIVEGQD